MEHKCNAPFLRSSLDIRPMRTNVMLYESFSSLGIEEICWCIFF
jgi:hypothetical protein